MTKRRASKASILSRVVHDSVAVKIEIPFLPTEEKKAGEALALLSLISSPEDLSWVMRPLRFRGFQIKRKPRGWMGYLKAVDPQGQHVVALARGPDHLDVLADLWVAATGGRSWVDDPYPLKY